jgi:hypothetical protein
MNNATLYRAPFIKTHEHADLITRSLWLGSLNRIGHPGNAGCIHEGAAKLRAICSTSAVPRYPHFV